MINRELLAWAAGLFDGEGSVILTNNQRGTNSGNIIPQISLSMTHEQTVRKFKEIVILGTVSPEYKPKNPKHLSMWKFYSYGDDAIRICKLLLEFLVTKRHQAKVLLDFNEIPTTYEKGIIWEKRLSLKTIACRQVLLDELQLLNKRGR